MSDGDPQLVIDQIVAMRRKKWSARTIVLELNIRGVSISVATVTRWLHRVGLNRLNHLDVDGEPLRAPGKISARYPGHMIHVDVKKVGRIPEGGGWRVHGRGSDESRANDRAKTGGARAGYVYLHSAVDGFSRLAYTEPLHDETAIAFLSRARVFFAAHGITRITRVVTDNGSCYPPHAFTRTVQSFAVKHQRIRPYTPKHNGKVERYQRTLAVELLYARPSASEAQRSDATGTWLVHYNYHRPHTAAADQAPASQPNSGVTNVMSNHT